MRAMKPIKQKLAVSLAFGLCLLAQAASADSLKDDVAADYGYLFDLYQHLHRNPELSFQEQESAKRMAAEVAGLGFDVTTDVGGHGVVAVLKNVSMFFPAKASIMK